MNWVYSIIWSIVVCGTTGLGVFVLSRKTDYLVKVPTIDGTAAESLEVQTKLLGLEPGLFNKIFIFLAGLFAFICAFFSYKDSILVTDSINSIFVFSALSLASVTDIHSHRIPNIIPISMLSARVILLIADFALQREAWEQKALLSFAIALLMFLVFYGMSRFMHGGIGFGDVKIITALAFMMGIRDGFSVIFISLLVCVLFSLVLLITKTKKIKDEIPFGPFLFVANIIFLLLNA